MSINDLGLLPQSSRKLRPVSLMVTALVPIADGSEEIETVSIVDTLVRAGIEVTMASVMDGKAVKCSRAHTEP